MAPKVTIAQGTPVPEQQAAPAEPKQAAAAQPAPEPTPAPAPEPAPTPAQKPAAPAPKIDAGPAPKIDASPAPQAADEPAAQAAQPAPAQNGAAEPAARKERRSASETAAGVRTSVLGFFDALVPGHGHAALGGALGLLCALLVFWIGLGPTLVIALFVVAGVALGQLLDGDGSIVRSLRNVINSTRGDNR